MPVLRDHVAEMLEGEQDPPHHRPGEVHVRRDLGDAHGGVSPTQRAEHLHAALDALDPIARSFLRHPPPPVVRIAFRMFPSYADEPAEGGAARPIRPTCS